MRLRLPFVVPGSLVRTLPAPNQTYARQTVQFQEQGKYYCALRTYNLQGSMVQNYDKFNKFAEKSVSAAYQS